MVKNGLHACVFGASGYIGTNLVPKLVAQGYSVRAVARNMGVLPRPHGRSRSLIATGLFHPLP